MPSLMDRLDAMSPRELREEVVMSYRAHGYGQAQLYRRISELECRIFQQRQEINRLKATAMELSRLAASPAPPPADQTAPTQGEG
jgi:hypothetical protein